MVLDLGDALDHAHAQGVIHRDVKPANVLIREDGMTKLADLGIATASDGTRITRSGIVLGTAAYMAPEQLDGREIGPPADIYALAAIAFEALSGRKPREGRTPMEIAHRMANEGPPDLSRGVAQGAEGGGRRAEAGHGLRPGGPARRRPASWRASSRRRSSRRRAPPTRRHAPASAQRRRSPSRRVRRQPRRARLPGTRRRHQRRAVHAHGGSSAPRPRSRADAVRACSL